MFMSFLYFEGQVTLYQGKYNIWHTCPAHKFHENQSGSLFTAPSRLHRHIDEKIRQIMSSHCVHVSQAEFTPQRKLGALKLIKRLTLYCKYFGCLKFQMHKNFSQFFLSLSH